MNFECSDKVKALVKRLNDFMQTHIYPIEADYDQSAAQAESRWATPPLMEKLKAEAKAAGLWNLFLPDSALGAGLSNLEYAPLAEIMGRVLWASEVFNCSAPDTGNMELLAVYGSEAQKKQWLQPLLAGEIRSAFAMSEPNVASCDATNIETSMVREGDEYVINGRKWFITGAMHQNCKILIVMGKTAPNHANRHLQQSQIIVPMPSAGLEIVRPMQTFGYQDAPFGHAELQFQGVRVPASNLILGEGRGFEMAQGRLGPGRIHHCMRLVGIAQRALEMMCQRSETRVAFGKKLSAQGSVREDIARSNCEIEQARLLTLKAAAVMDQYGNKQARDLIAMIKIIAPQMACTVIDRAIQLFGAAGLSQDLCLASGYQYARAIRLADGPDQVHLMVLAKQLLRTHSN